MNFLFSNYLVLNKILVKEVTDFSIPENIETLEKKDKIVTFQFKASSSSTYNENEDARTKVTVYSGTEENRVVDYISKFNIYDLIWMNHNYRNNVLKTYNNLLDRKETDECLDIYNFEFSNDQLIITTSNVTTVASGKKDKDGTPLYSDTLNVSIFTFEKNAKDDFLKCINGVKEKYKF